jgi:hypothetical protein
MVVAFLLASVEFGRGIHANHAIQEASQAACRVYSVKNATKEQAEAIIATSMNQAGIADYEVSYTPETKSLITTHMEPVTVTISVNYDDVGWVAGSFLNGATLSGSCIMPADLEIIDDYDPINPIVEEEEEEEEVVEEEDEEEEEEIPPKPWWWPWWWPWPI